MVSGSMTPQVVENCLEKMENEMETGALWWFVGFGLGGHVKRHDCY